MGYSIDFKNRDRLIQLGIAISTLRHIRGMSQEELAEKLDISWRHLQRLEHNESNTTVKTLKKLIK